MDSTREAKTVAVKACAACCGGLLEYDKFCRWCGARQPDLLLTLDEASDLELQLSASSDSLPLTTSRLEVGAQSNLYRRVSGPLVSAVVAGVSANTQARRLSPFVSRSILALISIPIWLIIILLSPFDAYAAAKNLLRE